MKPTFEVELPQPEPYKPPPPVDDASFFKEVGIGLVIAMFAIGLLIALVRALRDRKLAAPAKLVDHELVTLTGIVRPTGAVITAPLSGRACVMHRSRAVLETEAHAVVEGSDFMLEVDGKAIQVGFLGLTFAVAPNRPVPAQREREESFLERFGWKKHHAQVSFDEILIEPGAKIAIRGMLRIENDLAATDERGYRDSAPTRMRLVAPEGGTRTVVRIWD